MTGFRAKLERLECLAAECESIAKRVGASEREFYLRMSKRYRESAGDIEALIATFDIGAQADCRIETHAVQG